MFRWLGRGLVAGAILTGLVGCGDPDSGVQRKPMIVEDVPIADKVAYANQFPLFDIRSGTPGLPKAPNGTTPFGVLLGFVNRHRLEMCTVSHWQGNQVLTNAHCVETVKDPAAYYVVYFDQSGHHRYAAVQSFGYIGDTTGDDVASLQMDVNDVNHWDSLDATLESTDDSINAGLSHGNFEVTVWSFDPLSSHPELTEYQGVQGAVFYPKTCTGFRTQPDIELIGDNGESISYPSTSVDVHKHLLVDHCDQEPMQGNSGSWMSAAGDPTKGYGLFHWIITLRDQPIVRRLRTFEYTGSDGHTLLTPAVANFDFYFVGTDLRWVLGQHPDFLDQP